MPDVSQVMRRSVSSSLLILLPLFAIVAGCADRSPKPGPTASAPPPPPSSVSAAAPVALTPTIKIERINTSVTPRESSSIALGSIGKAAHAFIADEDDAAIVDVDVEEKAVSSSTPIGSRPRDLLLLADGRIAASLPEQAAVALFAREEGAKGKLREVARIKTAEEPLALALSPDDATLYVTTGSSHSLLSFQIEGDSLKEKARHSLGREPRAVLATAESVFVTHAAETYTSILSLADSKITTRNIDNRTQCGGHQCQGARTARGAQAIVRIGESGIVIPTAQSLPSPPSGFTKGYLCRPVDRANPEATRVRREAIEKNGVTGYGIGSGETGPPIIADFEVIDAKTGAFYGVGSHPLTASVHDHACLQPRAAVALGKESKDGLVVACLGSSIIMRSRGTERFDLNAVAARQWEYMGEGVRANVTADYVSVPAGPSGIAVDSEHSLAFVWSTFERKLSTIDLSLIGGKKERDKDATPSPPLKSSIEIARITPKDETWLAGRTLFYKNHDRRISADGRACANCHIDGRDDGLTWRTPMGPRRTRMLAGQTGTGPFGWKGDNATLEAHIKTTIHNLEGSGLPDEDMKKLSAFVTSISKAPAAAIAASDSAKGKEIFQSAECASCHTTGGSDRSLHDVGTGGGYLTPTLAGVATRDQLMHDGRYKNLDALLTGSTSMGRGSQLSPEDRQSLVKYLETL